MLLTPLVMRLLLVLCDLSMALIAVFFLRRRNLSLANYLGWGLCALLFPFVGPFLVLWKRPGR